MEKHQGSLFLQSALTLENKFNDLEQVLEWIELKKKETNINIQQIEINELKDWYIPEDTGNLVHKSGKFFSIEGINVKTNWGFIKEWEQPIINQPEVGILGIICKRFNGNLYFLLQAKIEPGNINFVQLSPTVQATKSNFSQVHKGKKPLYIEYFLSQKGVKVLVDQLQSEQGARFLKKRNRNIIIEIEDNIDVHPNFCWLTLAQIKKLLLYDNVINMDTRTVISCICYCINTEIELQHFLKDGIVKTLNKEFLYSAIDTKNALHSIKSIISWFTNLKSSFELWVKSIPLKNVKHWYRDEYSIYHKERKYFSVIAVNVIIGNREVKSWDQPLLKVDHVGIIAFIIKKINGVYHFLVQAKLEAGNFDIIELAPSVQCIADNYIHSSKEEKPAFLDFVLNVDSSKIKYDTYQSEEGGRFYKEQNRNMIIEVGDEFSTEVPEQYIWMTLNQMITLVQFNNYFNVEARSLMSTISFA
ncbi:NDP-hexose 2,3-dehydratase [Tolypothrix campylonemoides VB511288]|nr:NDP-hexose 2,3-dehydratase [Tolypothrix campylonemoides VB511288]